MMKQAVWGYVIVITAFNINMNMKKVLSEKEGAKTAEFI